MSALEATFLAESLSNLLRMLALMKPWTSLKMGGVGSVSRSLGQIFEKACEHCRSHIFGPIFLKYVPIISLDESSNEFENRWGRVNK